VGKAVQAETIILQLPISLSTFEKKNVVSGPHLTLYSKIKAFDSETEKMIVEAIVAELNLKHGADLAREIDFSRGGDTAQSSSTADPAIAVVGNSHASYLAMALAALGYKSSVVEMRPWRPNTITVNETRLELESKLACTPNVVAIIY
jgi:hypothetical protein